MFRILLLLALVGVVFWLVAGRKPRPLAPREAPPPKPPQGAQTMLSCAHCGVHLPRDDALTDSQGRAFCCEAHRLAGPR